MTVTSTELLDLLPGVLQHLSLQDLGTLRLTSRQFRSMPGMLARPKRASDKDKSTTTLPRLFDNPRDSAFLNQLPNLTGLELQLPSSLYDAHTYVHHACVKIGMYACICAPVCHPACMRHMKRFGDWGEQRSLHAEVLDKALCRLFTKASMHLPCLQADQSAVCQHPGGWQPAPGPAAPARPALAALLGAVIRI